MVLNDGGPLDVDSQTFWNRARILSIVELSLLLAVLLFVLMASFLVLRFAKLRMPMLFAVRICLCIMTTLWTCGLLGVTVAPWLILRPLVRLTSGQLSDACWIQLCAMAFPSSFLVLCKARTCTLYSRVHAWLRVRKPTQTPHITHTDSSIHNITLSLTHTQRRTARTPTVAHRSRIWKLVQPCP